MNRGTRSTEAYFFSIQNKTCTKHTQQQTHAHLIMNLFHTLKDQVLAHRITKATQRQLDKLYT